MAQEPVFHGDYGVSGEGWPEVKGFLPWGVQGNKHGALWGRTSGGGKRHSTRRNFILGEKKEFGRFAMFTGGGEGHGDTQFLEKGHHALRKISLRGGWDFS